MRPWEQAELELFEPANFGLYLAIVVDRLQSGALLVI